MRCTQFMGLTKEAGDFLHENGLKIPIQTCPKCGHVICEGLKSEEYADARNTGMFEDGPMLRRYTLKDGTTIEEVVQEVIWSSGPCIFLCLKKGEELLYRWTEEEINAA